VKQQIEQLGIAIFKLFRCRDYARVDLRVDSEGSIFVIEVNPNPDISPQSGMARAIQAGGMTYADFIGHVLARALQRRCVL
jgi:D-alanine-D-alanine ligase